MLKAYPSLCEVEGKQQHYAICLMTIRGDSV